MAVAPAISPVNLARAKALTAAVSSRHPVGDGVGALYTNYIDSAVSPGFVLSSGYSVFIDFLTSLTLSGNAGIFGAYGGTNYRAGFYEYHSTAAFRGAFWSDSSFTNLGQPTGGALTANTRYRLGLTHASATDTRLYSAGNMVAGNAVALPTQTIVDVSLGSTRGTSTEAAANPKFAHFLMWARPISDAEHLALVDGQWTIYRPLRRVLYFGAAAGGGATITPAAGTLTFAGYAPSVTKTAHQFVAPAAGALTFTGYAPTVSIAGASFDITPAAGALTFTGYAPTVVTTAHRYVTPPVGSLTFTGYAPSVSVGQNVSVTVPVGALAFTGYAPSVAVSVNTTITPAAGALTFTGYAPTVTKTANLQIAVPVGQLTFTGYAPTVVSPLQVSPAAGSLAFTGHAPTVANSSDNIWVEITGASSVWTDVTPDSTTWT